MKRSLTTLLLAAFITSCVAAAAAAAVADDKKKDAKPRPDLSGVWALDLKRSKWEGSMRTGRPRFPVRLVIRHQEPEVRMTRTVLADDGERVVELTFYADGRGEKNPAVSAGEDRLKLSGTVESEARWKDGRLVIRGTKNLRTLGDLNQIDFTERWELSADGRTLTQTTSHDNPRDGLGAAAAGRIGSDYTYLTLSDTKFVYTREQ